MNKLNRIAGFNLWPRTVKVASFGSLGQCVLYKETTEHGKMGIKVAWREDITSEPLNGAEARALAGAINGLIDSLRKSVNIAKGPDFDIGED